MKPLGTTTGEARFLNVHDVAFLTGESVSVWRKRLLFRKIPYIKAGRNVRIDRDDLQAWLESRKVPAYFVQGGAKK